MQKKNDFFHFFILHTIVVSSLSFFVLGGCHKTKTIYANGGECIDPNDNPVPPDTDFAFRGVGNQNSLTFTLSPLALAEFKRLSTTTDLVEIDCSSYPNSITYQCEFDALDSMWHCAGTILLEIGSEANYYFAPSQTVSTVPPSAILYDNVSPWCPGNLSLNTPISINNVLIEGGFCSLIFQSEGC